MFVRKNLMFMCIDPGTVQRRPAIGIRDTRADVQDSPS